MKRPIFAVACALMLLVAPEVAAQGSRPSSRPRRQAQFDGSGLAGSVKFAEVDSKLLGRTVRYGVYLPPGYDESANAKTRYPVVFFLHGLFEGAERWMGRGGAELFDNAIKNKKLPPMLLIFPDAGMSFYADTLDGKKPYARFFVEELVPFVDKTYRTTGDRRQRIVAGQLDGRIRSAAIRLEAPRPLLGRHCS